MRLITGPASARRKLRGAATIAVASVAVLIYACSAHPGAHGGARTGTPTHADPDTTITAAPGSPAS
ncbi:MAG: hypothetical protein JO242_18090, partial [Streptosporangiaceae bacterium]|nr:hypothetical protein [Streptosporangiaceae bacterium]